MTCTQWYLQFAITHTFLHSINVNYLQNLLQKQNKWRTRPSLDIQVIKLKPLHLTNLRVVFCLFLNYGTLMDCTLLTLLSVLTQSVTVTWSWQRHTHSSFFHAILHSTHPLSFSGYPTIITLKQLGWGVPSSPAKLPPLSGISNDFKLLLLSSGSLQVRFT